MIRLVMTFAVLAGLATAYIAAPFVTAWSIREAVRSGDAAYLERAIDWPSVRLTLKPSLTELALNEASQSTASTASLWQRLKTYVGAGAVATAVDNAVTPEGLTRMFNMRKAYRTYVSGEPDDASLPVTERMKRTWARVKRAEFKSLTRFEVDMTDKLDETRLYLAKLELTASGWMLKELRVRQLEDAAAGVQKFATTTSEAPIVLQPDNDGGFFARALSAAQPKS